MGYLPATMAATMTGPGDYGASDYSDYGPKSQRLSSDYGGSKDLAGIPGKNGKKRGKPREKGSKTPEIPKFGKFRVKKGPHPGVLPWCGLGI